MKLTVKQEKFCIKYIECGNASEAYRFAYNCERMKSETINRKASAMLKRGKIRARIKELQDDVAKKLLISDDSVLREYLKIGLSDIRKIVNDKGGLKSLTDLDDDIAAAISSVKVVTRSTPLPDGDVDVEYVSEIKLWSKTQALDSLSKHLGLFEKHNEQKAERNININAIPESIRGMLDAVYKQNRGE